jgi:hypothetical protein
MRVFVQPCASEGGPNTGLAAWLKGNLGLLNKRRTAPDGWCLALLALTSAHEEPVISAMMAVDQAFEGSAPVLRAHYADSKWPEGNAVEARQWLWVISASAMPPLDQVTPLPPHHVF